MKSIFTQIYGILIFCAFSATASPETFNVSDFGAAADGKTDNTAALQKAIDACSSSGGGEVVFDKNGVYLSATLNMKSGVTLNIPFGATLKGLKSPLYKRALIYAESVENIGITGAGTIDGTGAEFEIRDSAPNRPMLIRFDKSKNIRIENIFLTAPAAWTLFLFKCDDALIHKVRVFSHSNYNNDGFDIESSNVVISDCQIDSFDDAIVLKATKSDSQVENVVITNCIVSSGASALKIGTETLGNIRNVNISNCAVKKCKVWRIFYEERKAWIEKYGLTPEIAMGTGIMLCAVDGGLVENVNISNLTIGDCHTPIAIRVGHRNRGVSDELKSSMRNILIRGITAKSESWIASSITSLPAHTLENVRISDSIFHLKAGAPKDKLENAMKSAVGEKEKNYPSSKMYGTILPASAFYARHASSISFENLTIRYWNGEERRPAFVADDVSNLRISGCSYEKSLTEKFADIKSCKNAILESNSPLD